MTVYRTTLLMLSSAAFLSLSGSAFALDGTDLLKKINAAYNLQGGSLVADSIDVDGTTVTLKGVSFKASGTDAESFALGDVTLTGVEQDQDGGYFIDAAAFPNVNKTQDGVTISAENMTLGGISVPADATGDGLDSLLLYETARSGPFKVSQNGADVFSLGETELNLRLREDESGFDFDGAFKDLKADLSKTEDAESRQAIEKLALQHVQGDITTKGSWDLTPGTVNIEEVALDLTNVGRLDMSFSISGYTLQFVKSLQDTIKASEANPNKEEAQQAAGLALLGLMQQLSFNGAAIRFDDASITQRALDYAGSQQGVSGKQMSDSLKALAPLMLAQLNIPELQNAASAAISAYLDDPKNFTVSAAPAKPVPFPMIMGAAMGAPNTLPQVLGVTVSANN